MFLLVSDLPAYELQYAQQAVRDHIYWTTHPPRTQEERDKANNAFIRLRQADWHLTKAVEGK